MTRSILEYRGVPGDSASTHLERVYEINVTLLHGVDSPRTK